MKLNKWVYSLLVNYTGTDTSFLIIKTLTAKIWTTKENYLSMELVNVKVRICYKTLSLGRAIN